MRTYPTGSRRIHANDQSPGILNCNRIWCMRGCKDGVPGWFNVHEHSNNPARTPHHDDNTAVEFKDRETHANALSEMLRAGTQHRTVSRRWIFWIAPLCPLLHETGDCKGFWRLNFEPLFGVCSCKVVSGRVRPVRQGTPVFCGWSSADNLHRAERPPLQVSTTVSVPVRQSPP